MNKYRGTLRKNPLEGGFFELHAENGTVYRLEGAVKGKDGDKVEVSGREASSGGFGIHMTSSPSLQVMDLQVLG